MGTALAWISPVAAANLLVNDETAQPAQLGSGAGLFVREPTPFV